MIQINEIVHELAETINARTTPAADLTPPSSPVTETTDDPVAAEPSRETETAEPSVTRSDGLTEQEPVRRGPGRPRGSKNRKLEMPDDQAEDREDA